MMNDIALKHTPLFTSKALHNGRAVIAGNKKLMIVLFVLHMTGLPLVMGAALLQLMTHDYPDPDVYVVIAGFTSAFAGLAGIACALTAMPYLYRKLSVDMRMSLPITTDQRFISDYCAGLFTYVVPFVASQVFTVLITVIGHLAFDGSTEGDVISYSTSKTIINFFSEAAPYLFRLATGYLLMMLVFYAMCVLVMTCCGSILEAIMYSVLLNLLVPGCIAVVLAAMCERVLGLDFEFYLEFSLPFTSHAGMLYYLI
ncbi:MAG: hypothetical protein J6X85_01370 [Ruminococcus sp.]|nr:hypothetical protein [Ruminococcus sp.]